MTTSLKKYLIILKKRRVITLYPPPIIPFILAFLFLAVYILVKPLGYKDIELALSLLFIFTLIFAIIHLIIVNILRKK